MRPTVIEEMIRVARERLDIAIEDERVAHLKVERARKTLDRLIEGYIAIIK